MILVSLKGEGAGRWCLTLGLASFANFAGSTFVRIVDAAISYSISLRARAFWSYFNVGPSILRMII